MPVNIQAIKKDIEEMLATISSGCRVQVDGPETLVIYHCNHWDSHLESLVYSYYPLARISLKSSSLSLSGFKVVLVFPRTYMYHWIIIIMIGLVLVYLGRDEIRLALSSFQPGLNTSVSGSCTLSKIPNTTNVTHLAKPTARLVRESQEYKRLTRKPQTQQGHQDNPDKRGHQDNPDKQGHQDNPKF